MRGPRGGGVCGHAAAVIASSVASAAPGGDPGGRKTGS